MLRVVGCVEVCYMMCVVYCLLVVRRWLLFVDCYVFVVCCGSLCVVLLFARRWV